MIFFSGGGNSIKNFELTEVFFESEKSNRHLAVFHKLCLLMNFIDVDDENRSKLMSFSRFFCLKLKKLLDDASRNREKFCERNEEWLNKEIQLPLSFTALPDITNQPGPSRTHGRPLKPFEEASLKTRKRRVSELVSERTYDELQFAADVVGGTPEKHGTSSLTPHQALALYLDLDLSENKYKVLRRVVNAVHPNCFPSLYQLNKTKNFLLPSLITVTETSAEVNLQELLQLTARSIINVATLEEGSDNFKLVCKWGFDGSSGHSQYKQIFSDSSSTDEYLFLIALVPLKLIDLDSGRDVWVNPRPSSTLYCRPVKFMFKKENAELVRNEEKEMNEKISNLQACDLATESGQRCRVNCEMLFTMMDGSVSNVLSGTNSTSKCIICGATPKEMNTENVLNRPPNTENYRFGLSTLHCWIRFFECILHIAYRLPVKSWQVRGEEQKKIVENNKQKIQADFKSKMGLLVDKPKPGYGSTNDGNTARRFFLNPDLSAEITGIEKELIVKFSTILRVLASGYHINFDNFKCLLNETRQMYISLYGWYYMPSSVHKVLIHGCEIIDAFSLPIGHLSEDALEARHKEVRKNRLSHTRKCSRESSNTDLIRILLLTSEPLLSSKRNTTINKGLRMDGEVQKYIKQVDEPSATSSLNLNLDLYFSRDQESSDSD